MSLLILQLKKSDLSELSDQQKWDVIEYKLYMPQYHKFCHHHWKPEDTRRVTLDGFKGNNTGILLWGERGCGKSQTLAYVTAWAHENYWVNVSVTNFERFTGMENKVDKTDLFRFKNGLYLQKDLAAELLSDFKKSNEQVCNEFEVDMSYYGKYDISGIKDGEAEPCPRVWDESRKTWSDEWKQLLYAEEIKAFQDLYDKMNYRLSDKLRDPKKLIEIVEAGIENPEIATCAFAEVLE